MKPETVSAPMNSAFFASVNTLFAPVGRPRLRFGFGLPIAFLLLVPEGYEPELLSGHCVQSVIEFRVDLDDGWRDDYRTRPAAYQIVRDRVQQAIRRRGCEGLGNLELSRQVGELRLMRAEVPGLNRFSDSLSRRGVRDAVLRHDLNAAEPVLDVVGYPER